jgi:hypothetical protein
MDTMAFVVDVKALKHIYQLLKSSKALLHCYTHHDPFHNGGPGTTYAPTFAAMLKTMPFVSGL